MDKRTLHGEFFGTTTLGEKGQVVIPAEARKAIGVDKGEKLLVFGMGEGMIVFAKLSQLEKFTAKLSQRLESMQKIVRKTKKS